MTSIEVFKSPEKLMTRATFRRLKTELLKAEEELTKVNLSMGLSSPHNMKTIFWEM